VHPSTFEYLKPSDEQLVRMAHLRQAAKDYCCAIERDVHDGPDKTYIIRKVREIAMWANVAVTRHADGTPRS
jgi:hypothetical protein